MGFILSTVIGSIIEGFEFLAGTITGCGGDLTTVDALLDSTRVSFPDTVTFSLRIIVEVTGCFFWNNFVRALLCFTFALGVGVAAQLVDSDKMIKKTSVDLTAGIIPQLPHE